MSGTAGGGIPLCLPGGRGEAGAGPFQAESAFSPPSGELQNGPSLFQTLFLPSSSIIFLFLLVEAQQVLERFGRVRHHFFFFREGKKDHTHFCLSSKNFKTKKHSSQTVVAALDMPLPEDYIRRLAPPPRSDSSVKCVVTGEPAKYRDPVTGAPYATVEAFKALRARGVVGSAAAAAVQALKAASVAAAGEFFSSSFLSFQKTRSLCTEAPGFFYS